MPKFVTNQNIEIDLELASLGDRILAFLIDLVIMIALLVAISYIVSEIGMDGWTISLFYIPLMFYSFAFEYFGNGQTLGKRALDIKVVKLDGATPAVGGYLLRWLFRIIDLWLYPLVFAPAVITYIATKNGQRIGDIVAGTAVIKIRKVGAAQAFKTVAKADHQVIYPVVKSLNDEQIELIKKALKMRKEGINYQGVEVLARKLKDKLNIDSKDPDVKFLYTIIADYEFLANEGF
ncbi:MAG: RDD family protein [Bacteroidota bacterium]